MALNRSLRTALCVLVIGQLFSGCTGTYRSMDMGNAAITDTTKGEHETLQTLQERCGITVAREDILDFGYDQLTAFLSERVPNGVYEIDMSTSPCTFNYQSQDRVSIADPDYATE